MMQTCKGCKEIRLCDPILQLCGDCEITAEVNKMAAEEDGAEAAKLRFSANNFSEYDPDEYAILDSDQQYHGDNYTGE